MIQVKSTVYHGGGGMEQEPDAADHIILAARKQRKVNTGSQFAFSLLFRSRLQTVGWH